MRYENLRNLSITWLLPQLFGAFEGTISSGEISESSDSTADVNGGAERCSKFQGPLVQPDGVIGR